MDFELRQAKAEDVGQLAYIMMLWRQELPPESRFFGEEAWIAERAAQIAIFNPSYLTKVLMDGDKMIAESITIKNDEGFFSPLPFGVLLSVYVKPEYRGHLLLGYKLLCDAVKSAKDMGMSRVEFNPMVNDRGTALVLKRLGFKPICTTHFLELTDGKRLES